MKRKNMIMCLAVFIVMLNCTLGTASDGSGTSKLTQQQLDKIDSYIAGLRQSMEDNYRYRAAELKSRTENKIRLLKVADMDESFSSLNAQAEIAQRVLEFTNYVPHTRRFRINAQRHFREAEKRESYYSYAPSDISYGPICKSYGPVCTRYRPARLFATFQTLVAEAKSDIYKRYQAGCVTLQKNKEYDLNVVLPKLEQKLKQNLKTSGTKTASGVISGIVYSQDKKSAVVDGKIVRQGDSLGEIKIVGIYRDHIEFEKHGKNWTQKPGQPAASYWGG